MAWHNKFAAASMLVLTVAAGSVVTAQQRGGGPGGAVGGSGGGGGNTAPSSKTPSQTWTGQISDAMCKGVHKGKDAKDCTAECVKNGSKYVLVLDEKTIYNIDNQKFGDLKKFAGTTAVVTGTMKDDTITIKKIEAPKAK